MFFFFLQDIVDNRSDIENKILGIICFRQNDYKKLLNDWIASKLMNSGWEAGACINEWETVSAEGLFSFSFSLLFFFI